jgi:hypothetical protein
MMISAPMDKTIFVNPPYGNLSPAASHVQIGVSLEFLTIFFRTHPALFKVCGIIILRLIPASILVF